MATSAINTKKSTFAIDTEKQETRINATVTDIKEVKVFVNWRLSIYKENRWKGFDLQESFINDFESFIKDILNNLGKDRLKKIRDYLRENGVYIRKEARKLIADGLLGVIYEPTPLKWPTDNPADDPTNNPTNDPTDGPTDDLTLALPLLLTTPVQTTRPIAIPTPIPIAITPPRTQIPTPTTPQLPITLIPQPIATVTTPPRMQTPTPVTP